MSVTEEEKKEILVSNLGYYISFSKLLRGEGLHYLPTMLTRRERELTLSDKGGRGSGKY